MNRTIKFRGKHKTTEEWVYGDLEHLPNNNIHIFSDHASQPVIAETVGQFTGLHDRNGREIYEGDIVRIRENIGREEVGAVEFIDGCFFVEVKKSETYTFRHALHIKKSVWKDMNANIPIEYEYEVIGNIVDNPELIEQ